MKHKIKEYEERFYIGVEYEGGIQLGVDPKIGQFWSDFLNDDLNLLIDVPNNDRFIGLECYPPDMKETKTFDYYALLETKKIEKIDGFVSKKLPKGKYISFEIEFDDLFNQIHTVYGYIKDHNINVHMGFDFEDYLQGQDYTKPGAKLHLSFLLNDE